MIEEIIIKAYEGERNQKALNLFFRIEGNKSLHRNVEVLFSTLISKLEVVKETIVRKFEQRTIIYKRNMEEKMFDDLPSNMPEYQRNKILNPPVLDEEQYNLLMLSKDYEKEFIDYLVSKKDFNNPYTPPTLYVNMSDVDNGIKTLTELLDEQQKALPPQQTEKLKPEPKETELPERIKKHFGFLLGNCPRKGKPILTNENDFNKLIEWTTYFFKNNFEVPKISEPIKSVNTNKYIIQLAYQLLFVELRKNGFHNQRTNAKTLFNLWESSFLDYKGDKENNFWKVKKKNDSGIDYDTEVKKLMLIE